MLKTNGERRMKYDEITLKQAKKEHIHLWKAFKTEFSNSSHEKIRKMVKIGVAIEKGFVRDESLDPLVEE